MKKIGILFAVAQARKKGGIVHVFDVCSDGLFPATELGKFGLKPWRGIILNICPDISDFEKRISVKRFLAPINIYQKIVG